MIQSSTTAKLSLFFLGWLALFSVAQPDAVREVRAQDRTVSTDSLQSARTRWEALPPEEKDRVRRRYERLQKMDSGERENLEKRAQQAKRMEVLRNRVLARLSDEERKQLESQPPERQRELIQEFVHEERRTHGQRIESMLPESMRDWLRDASPKERRERLQRFKEDTRERLSRLAVEELAKALEFGPDEIRRLERLPLDKRVETVMKLGKELTTKQLTTEGLPADFGVERWQKLASLPPEKFIAEVWHLENNGVLQGRWIGSRAGRERQRGREHSLRKALVEARRIQPSDLLDLSELPQSERGRRTNLLRRERVLSAYRAHGGLDQQAMTELEELTDWRFFRRARELADTDSTKGRRTKRQ